MNSYIANNENVDLWSIEKCIFCKGKIEEDSKILKCLHISCKDCTKRESTVSGVLCKCKIVTRDELIDYSVISPNQPQVKICYEKNCQVIAEKICMHCKNMYCKPCSKRHSIKNGNHSPALMMTYPLKQEFVPCPKCMENNVELFCTKCSEMDCALCHLRFHQKHSYKLLSTVADETYAQLQRLLTALSEEKNHVNFLKEKMSRQNIEKLKLEKKKIIDKISDEKFKLLHDNVDKRKLKGKKLLEIKLTNAVNNTIMNELVFDDFEKEIEYYHSFISSVMNCNKPIEVIKISKIIMKPIYNALKHTEAIPKETTNVNQGMGDISSSIIVDLSEYKLIVDSNNVLQALENDVRILQ